jgi:hypothetical protein
VYLSGSQMIQSWSTVMLLCLLVMVGPLATSSSLGSSRQLFLLLGVDLETGGEQTNWMSGRTKGDALG